MKVHAGETVKAYFAETTMSVSEFAHRLNCHRQNVYDIFKRQNIDLSLLQRISKVLEHDFVTELYGSPNSAKITLKFAVTVILVLAIYDSPCYSRFLERIFISQRTNLSFIIQEKTPIMPIEMQQLICVKRMMGSKLIGKLLISIMNNALICQSYQTFSIIPVTMTNKSRLISNI